MILITSCHTINLLLQVKMYRLSKLEQDFLKGLYTIFEYLEICLSFSNHNQYILISFSDEF